MPGAIGMHDSSILFRPLFIDKPPYGPEKVVNFKWFYHILVGAEDIDADAPLFGEGLGLDSIDALELIVLLEKNYGIKIEDPKDGKKIFFSIRTMAEYITEHQKH